MMKMLMMLMFMFLIFNLLNKNLFKLFYQTMLFFLILVYMMNYPFNNLNFNLKIYYFIGCDFYSMMLMILTLWILGMMIIMSGQIKFNDKILYMNLMNLLIIFLFLYFLSLNLMMFYIFFEASLIPIFMLIMGWGYQIERIQAGVYMMLYTLFGSLPLLLMILILNNQENSLMMNLLNMKNMNIIIYMMMILAFLIKMPMYFLHLWLPKAHVESPLVGSMILAGVMLKLGSYGLLRIMLMMINMSIKFNKFIVVISLMGAIYSSLVCLCQVDMKMLVAYSSVVHMSLLMSGLMTLFNSGYCGALMMMIAHGLCSSGLFCLVNISYERSHSRSMYINSGMINYWPSMTLMWFLLCSSNMSFPPSLNLFGEIMLLNSLIMWSKYLILILSIMSFFSASYTLYLYSKSQHGDFVQFNSFFKFVNIREYLGLLLHWIPLNFLFMFMMMFV